ncbi:MAG: hypothetical protein ABJC63_01670 [Gemmatimonadales bacterium]
MFDETNTPDSDETLTDSLRPAGACNAAAGGITTPGTDGSFTQNTMAMAKRTIVSALSEVRNATARIIFQSPPAR